jgi:hypothetical protein
MFLQNFSFFLYFSKTDSDREVHKLRQTQREDRQLEKQQRIEGFK